MKIKQVDIVPFEVGHALNLDVREHERPMQNEEAFKEWTKMNHDSGPSFTGLLEGKVLGCGGVRILWDGVGEAWALFSKEITKHPKEAYYYVNRFLKRIVDDWKLHRVQAHARADIKEAERYLENLGFKKEGLMRKFGPDRSDHWLFALIRRKNGG